MPWFRVRIILIFRANGATKRIMTNGKSGSAGFSPMPSCRGSIARENRQHCSADSICRCNTLNCVSRRGVANEAKTTDLLHGKPESADAGSLAERRVPAQQIAQLFDRKHSSIQGILARTGGIRPAPRCRSRLALSLAEREDISRAVAT
jgi:hypothetical protein